MQLTHLIFDLDGTVSEPAVGIARCFNHALASFGYPLIPEASISRYIGPPLDESFAQITGSVSDRHVAALVEKYRERYAETGYAENTIYPGIPEALEYLSQQGVLLGICTSKRVDFTEQILNLFGIREHFQFVSGGEIGVRKDQQLRKLILDRVTGVGSTMIGDRAIDIRAAQANGLRSVGVLWGHGTREELEDAGAGVLLERPGQLLELETNA